MRLNDPDATAAVVTPQTASAGIPPTTSVGAVQPHAEAQTARTPRNPPPRRAGRNLTEQQVWEVLAWTLAARTPSGQRITLALGDTTS